MSTPIMSVDLTKRPPRSIRVRRGGFVILARMLDKGRAVFAKKNGEYKYNSYTDQHLVRFLGFDPEALMVRRAGPRPPRELWRQTLIRRENGETPMQTQLAASPL